MPTRKLLQLLLPLAAAALLGACNHLPDSHELAIGPDGIRIDDSPAAPLESLEDTLRAFCRQENTVWGLTADSGAEVRHFYPLVAKIRSFGGTCHGLFRVKTPWLESIIGIPYLLRRTHYTSDESDTTKPFLSLTIYTSRRGVALVTPHGTMPLMYPIIDSSGREFLRGGNAKPPVRYGWVDRYYRCLVPLRQAMCADTLEAGRRYALLGNVARLIDTVTIEEVPYDGDRFRRVPLPFDIALPVSIHALRTLPGAMGRGVFFHAMIDSTLPLERLLSQIAGMRRGEVDLTSFELR